MYIIKKRYDIVHTDAGHRIASGIPCWLYKTFYRTKYISEWWDYYGKGGQYDAKPAIWRYTYGLIDNYFEIMDKKIANGVVALSHFTKQRALKEGIGRTSVVVINGGADVRQIKYVPDQRFRKLYRLNENDFVICFAGVTGELDFGPCLLVFSEIRKKLNLKIVTTGRFLNKATISKYNLNDDLIELGWVDYNDYFKILSLADVFILYQQQNNSNKAKWPNKIGDYLCAGRVIVTNPINDVAFLTKERTKSILACEMDMETIKKLILALYANRNDLMTTGRANRRIAVKNSWAVRAKQLENFYIKILNLQSPE